MEINPYSSPSASLFGSTAATTALAVSEASFRHLGGTRSWMRFLSVLSWLLTGFMLLSATLIAIGTAVSGEELATTSPEVRPELLIAVAACYFAGALVFIIIPIRLWSAASAIRKAEISHSLEDFEAALDKQRSIWKTLGILAIITLVFGVLLLAWGVFAAAAEVKAAGALP